jgi:hypothetical protein
MKESLADRFYRGLIRILPFDFRSEFGDEMEATFREQRAATGRAGRAACGKCGGPLSATLSAWRRGTSRCWRRTPYALRMMRKNRGFTLATVLILGLGIGVNVHLQRGELRCCCAVCLMLRGTSSDPAAERLRTAWPCPVGVDLTDYRQQNRTLRPGGYHAMRSRCWRLEPHQVRTGVVSASFFGYLGVKPILGRSFTPTRKARLAASVILNYEFWKGKAGDPHIIANTR